MTTRPTRPNSSRDASDDLSDSSTRPAPFRADEWDEFVLDLRTGPTRPGAKCEHEAPDGLSFVVPGEPVPKGRARTVRPKGSSFVRTFTPKATVLFEQRVRSLCGAAVREVGWTWSKACRFAVTVRIFRTHHDAGGDVDNYAKAILDAVNGVAFADDRYVRSLSASLEAPDREQPRVEVTVCRVRAAKRAA